MQVNIQTIARAATPAIQFHSDTKTTSSPRRSNDAWARSDVAALQETGRFSAVPCAVQVYSLDYDYSRQTTSARNGSIDAVDVARVGVDAVGASYVHET